MRYVCHQGDFIKEKFEEKWSEVWLNQKEQLTSLHYTRDLIARVRSFLKHVTVLEEFASRVQVRLGRCNGIIVDNDANDAADGGAVFEREGHGEHVGAAHCQFFLDSCAGSSDNIRGSLWVWTDPKSQREWKIDLDLDRDLDVDMLHDSMACLFDVRSVIETWGDMINKMPEVSQTAVAPYLFPEFLEALREQLESTLNSCAASKVSLEDEDFRVASIRDGFRLQAVGCLCCCPTCGRKCDQPVYLSSVFDAQAEIAE